MDPQQAPQSDHPKHQILQQLMGAVLGAPAQSAEHLMSGVKNALSMYQKFSKEWDAVSGAAMGGAVGGLEKLGESVGNAVNPKKQMVKSAIKQMPQGGAKPLPAGGMPQMQHNPMMQAPIHPPFQPHLNPSPGAPSPAPQMAPPGGGMPPS